MVRISINQSRVKLMLGKKISKRRNDMKFLEWKTDKWLSEQGSVFKYDKLEHFLLSIIGTTFLFLLFLAGANLFVDLNSIMYSPTTLVFLFFISSLVGLIWEIKDGIVPYDGTHIQGFSWKDLIADTAGVFLTVFCIKLISYPTVFIISFLLCVVFLIKSKMKWRDKND